MPHLPTVSEEVCAAIQKELSEATGNGYVADLLRRLQAENPLLAQFIANFAITQQNPTGVSTAGLLVYRLLESQAEANRMRREFPREP